MKKFFFQIFSDHAHVAVVFKIVISDMNIRISPQKVHFLLLAALKDATESFQIVSAVFLK